MDNGFKISTILGLSLIAFPVSAAPLSSQTTTFSGTMPVSCEISGGVNSVAMSPTSLTQIAGTTGDMTFNSNAPVTLSLTPVTVGAVPSGVTGYSWVAALMDNQGGTLASTTESSAQAVGVNFNNGISNTALKIRMTVGPASGNVKPGTYTGTVTLNCLAL